MSPWISPFQPLFLGLLLVSTAAPAGELVWQLGIRDSSRNEFLATGYFDAPRMLWVPLHPPESSADRTTFTLKLDRLGEFPKPRFPIGFRPATHILVTIPGPYNCPMAVSSASTTMAATTVHVEAVRSVGCPVSNPRFSAVTPTTRSCSNWRREPGEGCLRLGCGHMLPDKLLGHQILSRQTQREKRIFGAHSVKPGRSTGISPKNSAILQSCWRRTDEL